ncbi:MAG: aspartate aminotransferase family protein [Alphaproteobacteria bacterium]|nr:aspartate aminotransferase family protein [Alphaproteobacteria bacterium]
MDEAPLWPFHASSPTVEIVAAKGAELVLADGRRVLDGSGGAIAVNVGHGRPEVGAAAAAAMTAISYALPPYATPHRKALVETLRKDWLPAYLPRALFACGGAEANDLALRLVRYYHLARGEASRHKIVSRAISYHGATMATLSLSGHPDRRRGLEPYLVASPKAPTPFPLHFVPGPDGMPCGKAAAEALDALIRAEGPETVAAFIGEPIVGASGGAIVPPDDYWPAVEAVCRRHGILFIADEVMTGFGRTGARFAIDHWGVTPDILVAGKGLASGYAPIVGIFARDEIADTLKEGGASPMFYTYSATSGACAAASAVLAILTREDLVARSARLGAHLVAALGERLGQSPHVAEIRGRGLMVGLEMVADRETLRPFPAEANVQKRVLARALELGAFVYPAGNGALRDCLLLGPPFVIAEAEIERLAGIVATAIEDVTHSLSR